MRLMLETVIVSVSTPLTGPTAAFLYLAEKTFSVAMPHNPNKIPANMCHTITRVWVILLNDWGEGLLFLAL